MRMKNSAGEECVRKFLGSREGFHRVCLIDDSASKYAVIGGSVAGIKGADWPKFITFAGRS